MGAGALQSPPLLHLSHAAKAILPETPPVLTLHFDPSVTDSHAPPISATTSCRSAASVITVSTPASARA